MDLSHPFEVVTPTVDGDVLQVLASAQAAFTPPQIQALAGRHSVSGVRKALVRLVTVGIVGVERVGQAFSYELNRDHLAAEHVVAIARLRLTLLEGMTAQLRGWSPPADYAALFGSAATGAMRTGSDLDVFVVRPDSVDADDDVWCAQRDQFARRVTGWTGNDTRVLELSGAETRAALAAGTEPVLADIREEGVRLVGEPNYLRNPRSRAKA